MAVKIGSARIDENGRATGGKAGDQTGREVSTQSWYLHSKGWRVFRAKDPQKAEMIAQDMQWACDNKHIGYDQGQRGTLYTASRPLGFNCKEVAAPCETDCSALVRVCCAYAGIDLPNFRTTDEAGALLGSGAFEELRGAKYTDSDKYLRRGDILVTRTQGHTVVALSDGAKAEEDAPEKPAAPSKRVLRRGDEGEDVQALQQCLEKLGHSLPRYGCDGEFGPETEAAVMAFQRESGLEATGVFDGASCEAMLSRLCRSVEIYGDSVNVRRGPGIEYDVLGVARVGEKLPFRGRVCENGWLMVGYQGTDAWVSGKYGRVTA